MRFFIATVTVLLAVSASSVQSQPTAGQAGTLPVLPGTRVRVTATNLVAPLIGSFLHQKGDTAVFVEDGGGRGIWSLTLSQITRLEQSDGDKRRNTPYLLKGAVYGAPAGAVAAFIFVKAFSPDSSKQWNTAPTVAIGAVVGAGIGAAIGSRYAREHWSNVAVPRRVGLVPSRRGLNATVGFSF